MDKGEKAEMELENPRLSKASRASCLSVSQCASSHLPCALQTGDEQHVQQFLTSGFGISHHRQVSLGKGDLESHCQRRVPAAMRGSLKTALGN